MSVSPPPARSLFNLDPVVYPPDPPPPPKKKKKSRVNEYTFTPPPPPPSLIWILLVSPLIPPPPPKKKKKRWSCRFENNDFAISSSELAFILAPLSSSLKCKELAKFNFAMRQNPLFMEHRLALFANSLLKGNLFHCPFWNIYSKRFSSV